MAAHGPFSTPGTALADEFIARQPMARQARELHEQRPAREDVLPLREATGF